MCDGCAVDEAGLEVLKTRKNGPFIQVFYVRDIGPRWLSAGVVRVPSIEWSDVAAEAMERDPREFPFGYLTGGSFVMDSVRVFVWFRTLEDLLTQIRDVEPRVYDLEPGAGLEDYQLRVAPILARVRAEGLTEPLRDQVNAAVNQAFVVDWWGSYTDLKSGCGKTARAALDDFLGEEREGQALPEEEEEKFIEFLKTWGV
jgi:hypothetical protein